MPFGTVKKNFVHRAMETANLVSLRAGCRGGGDRVLLRRFGAFHSRLLEDGQGSKFTHGRTTEPPGNGWFVSVRRRISAASPTAVQESSDLAALHREDGNGVHETLVATIGLCRELRYRRSTFYRRWGLHFTLRSGNRLPHGAHCRQNGYRIMSTMSKAILITGASSGMGREAAILLAREGHRVYAGARRLDRMQDLAEHGITAVEMDVTSSDDNQRAVQRMMDDGGRIDVLINNAGFGLYGPVEDVPLDDARYQLEVNLFGLAHLTRLVLPHMRAQGSGRIINTSSMGGRIFTPFGAWYHATKHALEGWSDCLRLETAPFNIQVVLIEPGLIRTEFGQVLGGGLQKYYEGSAYKAQLDRFFAMMSDPKAANRGTDAEVLARVFLEAATTGRPRRRYVKGATARPLLFIRKWFGDGIYESVLRRTFG